MHASSNRCDAAGMLGTRSQGAQSVREPMPCDPNSAWVFLIDAHAAQQFPVRDTTGTGVAARPNPRPDSGLVKLFDPRNPSDNAMRREAEVFIGFSVKPSLFRPSSQCVSRVKAASGSANRPASSCRHRTPDLRRWLLLDWPVVLARSPQGMRAVIRCVRLGLRRPCVSLAARLPGVAINVMIVLIVCRSDVFD
jgi:hypothetical protein